MLEVTGYRQSRFNQLPSIEAADAALRQADKLQLALSVLQSVFVTHHMCQMWGICVLHRHFLLKANEVPVQVPRGSREPRALITRPRGPSFITPRWPSVLAASSGEGDGPLWEALEFAADERARQANLALAAAPAFSRQVREKFIAHDLADTFGLIVARPSTTAELERVEFNYRDRVSVLRETRFRDGGRPKLIQTAWLFATDKTGTSCTASCFSACVDTGDDHYTQHTALHDPHGDTKS